MTTETEEKVVQEIELSEDQQNAYDRFFEFYDDPDQRVFVIKGGAGCGKSTLLRVINETLKKRSMLYASLGGKAPYKTVFTATSNKAADNLYIILGEDVTTIHSTIGARVDPIVGLVLNHKNPIFIQHSLVFVDEAGTLDTVAMNYMWQRIDMTTCKVIFIGDADQLLPMKSTYQPAFSSKYKTVELETVRRRGVGNPITDMANAFRQVVRGAPWPSLKPDGFHIQRLSVPEFEAAIEAEFSRKEWVFHDSKILCWKNDTVIGYNREITEMLTGHPEFQKGDYAICNSYIRFNGVSISTDQTVLIQDVTPKINVRGVPGTSVMIHDRWFFCPDDPKAIRIASSPPYSLENWIDLRASYAQTTDKSQGSTYDKVFIDLDDIAKCHSGNRIARMMYVGISRARSHVYLKGDLA